MLSSDLFLFIKRIVISSLLFNFKHPRKRSLVIYKTLNVRQKDQSIGN